MTKPTTDKVEIKPDGKVSGARLVDLGHVADLTGGNSSGQFNDNSGTTSSNRKDEYGGAGER